MMKVKLTTYRGGSLPDVILPYFEVRDKAVVHELKLKVRQNKPFPKTRQQRRLEK